MTRGGPESARRVPRGLHVPLGEMGDNLTRLCKMAWEEGGLHFLYFP